MQLTTFQRQVLMGLLSASNPVAVSDLAHALKLSTSRLNHQLPIVEHWLNERGTQLERQRGAGIWIDAGDQARRKLIEDLAAEDCQPGALAPEERRDLLVYVIHTSSEPLITQYFQNLLQVSRSTILKDLGIIADWYEERDLFLVRRPNFGTRLVGKEADWRKVFIELVLAHFDEPTLFHFCAEANVQTYPLMFFNPPLAELMSDYLSSLALLKARELVGIAESSLRTLFVDSDHLALTLHIALLMRRVAEQQVIEMDPAQLQMLIAQPAFQAACDVASLIRDSTGMMIPQSEVGHLAIQLLGAKRDRRLQREVPAEANMLAQTVLGRAGQILNRSLDTDLDLVSRLAAHLESTLKRLVFGLPIRNPLLEDIRSRYAEVYEATEQASIAICDYTGREIPPDEVAFIAMYVAGAMMRHDESRMPRVLIVCPSGAATSWLLHSRLKQEMPNVSILDVMSTRDLQRGVSRDADLVVSTVPLDETDRPTIVVRALLSSEDIRNVQRAISELANTGRKGIARVLPIL